MVAALGDARLVAVITAMAADADLVGLLVREARSQSPDVARLPEAENRRHVALLLAAGLRALSRHGDRAPRHSKARDSTGQDSIGQGSEAPDSPARDSAPQHFSLHDFPAHDSAQDFSAEDFSAAHALGADRAAQGIPITSLLRGVQAGRTRAVEIAVSRCRAAGVPDDVILAAVLEFDRYTGTLERHVIDGYHTAELELSRTTRDARTQLLRRLLLHGDLEPPAPGDLRAAGLRPGGRYHCLVSDVTDPVRARSLERRLPGVYGLVEGRLAGLAPHLPADVPDGGALVVVAPAAPLHAMREIHSLCVEALRVAARAGQRGVCRLADLAVETALAAQPVLAGLLGTSLLGPLDRSDDFHRELSATALAYLDHGRRLDRTAAALHVHPNTVRYRLDRLRDLTGLAVADDRATLPDALRWWWALHTWLDRPRDR